MVYIKECNLGIVASRTDMDLICTKALEVRKKRRRCGVATEEDEEA